MPFQHRPELPLPHHEVCRSSTATRTMSGKEVRRASRASGMPLRVSWLRCRPKTDLGCGRHPRSGPGRPAGRSGSGSGCPARYRPRTASPRRRPRPRGSESRHREQGDVVTGRPPRTPSPPSNARSHDGSHPGQRRARPPSLTTPRSNHVNRPHKPLGAPAGERHMHPVVIEPRHEVGIVRAYTGVRRGRRRRRQGVLCCGAGDHGEEP